MAYSDPSERMLQQGDLLADVRTFVVQSFDADGRATGILQEYAQSVLVTQDCDLLQDFGARFPADQAAAVSQDKLLFGMLICGVYEEDLVRAGKHRPEAKVFGAKEWKPVQLNQDPRFQYLGFVPMVGKRLVADFKDYFMVPAPFLYAELDARRVKCVAHMDTPYKEHLLQRFAWYLMRVGLPIDFHMLPQAPTSPAPPAGSPQLPRGSSSVRRAGRPA